MEISEKEGCASDHQQNNGDNGDITPRADNSKLAMDVCESDNGSNNGDTEETTSSTENSNPTGIKGDIDTKTTCIICMNIIGG